MSETCLAASPSLRKRPRGERDRHRQEAVLETFDSDQGVRGRGLDLAQALLTPRLMIGEPLFERCKAFRPAKGLGPVDEVPDPEAG